MSSIDDKSDIKLLDYEIDIINANLEENGKLSCLKAFKVAKLLKVDPMQISAITKSIGVKITNCELGVFGNLEFQGVNDEILNILQKISIQKKIECQKAWEIAKNFSLKEVGSTIKNSPLEVTYCKLGCFREKKGKYAGKS